METQNRKYIQIIRNHYWEESACVWGEIELDDYA